LTNKRLNLDTLLQASGGHEVRPALGLNRASSRHVRFKKRKSPGGGGVPIKGEHGCDKKAPQRDPLGMRPIFGPHTRASELRGSGGREVGGML